MHATAARWILILPMITGCAGGPGSNPTPLSLVQCQIGSVAQKAQRKVFRVELLDAAERVLHSNQIAYDGIFYDVQGAQRVWYGRPGAEAEEGAISYRIQVGGSAANPGQLCLRYSHTLRNITVRPAPESFAAGNAGTQRAELRMKAPEGDSEAAELHFGADGELRLRVSEIGRTGGG